MVEFFMGEVVDVDLFVDIFLMIDGILCEVFVLVFYWQVCEWGFVVQDDGVFLCCLIVDEYGEIEMFVFVDVFLSVLVLLYDDGFDIVDEEYVVIVEKVIVEEIGCGEGVNFVICCDFIVSIDVDDCMVVFIWFCVLLMYECGVYWMFVVFMFGYIVVGVSFEVYVVVCGGVVIMNLIFGIFCYLVGGVIWEMLIDFFFLMKEMEELFMVVDEEFKMMSVVCFDGGWIIGLYFKEMLCLIYIEYMFCGCSGFDLCDIFWEMMFVLIVMGLLMQNVCVVIW